MRTNIVMSTWAIVVELLELVETSFLGVTEFSNRDGVGDEII